MSSSELSEIHKKLDTLVTGMNYTNINLEKQNGDIKAIREHLKTLNGKVLRNMNEIEEIRKEDKLQAAKLLVDFKGVEEKINKNENSIVFARGGIYALTFISIILGITLTLKSFGFI